MNDIVISGLCVAFGDKKVFDGRSFRFVGGAITCVGGPSGSGKTTLLNVIAGLIRAGSGEITGVPGKISYIFQENRLFDDFTAVRNLRIACGSAADKEKIVRHLTALGLENDLDKPVREFSGGMKRRVAIARAVLYDSGLILMDEPFKGLDEKLKLSVMDYVLENRNGRTVICVTHDPDEAKYMGAEYMTL